MEINHHALSPYLIIPQHNFVAFVASAGWLFFGQLFHPVAFPANSRAGRALGHSRGQSCQQRGQGDPQDSGEMIEMIGVFFENLLDVCVKVCVFFLVLGWLVVSTYDDLKGPVCGILENLSQKRRPTINHQQFRKVVDLGTEGFLKMWQIFLRYYSLWWEPEVARNENQESHVWLLDGDIQVF